MALSNNNIGACFFYDLRHNCLHYIKDNDPIYNIGACFFYDLRHNCLHYIKDNDPIYYADYAVLY